MNKELLKRLTKFRDDRDWAQFHSGENLAKSICIEASELLEVFQWSDKEKSIDKIKEELADVLLYCALMADKYHLDIDEIMLAHERSVRNSLNRTIHAIYKYSRQCNWEYFITLTFNKECVNRYDFSECMKKANKWFQHQHDRFAHDLKYLFVE